MGRSNNIIIIKYLSVIIFLLISNHIGAQNSIRINATLDPESHVISTKQELTYHNTSKDTLTSIYLNDWMNAYSQKNTPLAIRFAEEFKKSLHLAKEKDRGYTTIFELNDNKNNALQWHYLDSDDLIKIELTTPLLPNEKITLNLEYHTKLPSDKFTGYGRDTKGNYNLKYWYLWPAVYKNHKWELYSNKNLDDAAFAPTNYSIKFKYPKNLTLVSNFEELIIDEGNSFKEVLLEGKNRKECTITLNHKSEYQTFITEYFTLKTNFSVKGYPQEMEAVSIGNVLGFVNSYFKDYPHEFLLVSQSEYNKNPLYGLNQLPSFIQPYQKQFLFEIGLLKTLLNNYIKETLYTNPRTEKWIADALQNYLMIKFTDKYYPNSKLIGKFSGTWLFRSFYYSKMSFNDQYPFLYMLMARKNLDQSLSTRADSLIKFNFKIANKYKAGLGLSYLGNYIGEENVDQSIRSFYNDSKLKPTSALKFKHFVKQTTSEDVNWFFNEYINTNKRIDFKIKSVSKTKDSLHIILKNKTGTNVPISLTGLYNDTITTQYWFNNITGEEKVSIPWKMEDRLVLNYNKVIPEYNQRDNWKSLKGILSSNKKINFHFFQDAENPYRNQIFYVPVLNYNLYDGLSPGLRLYNKTFLERPFFYDISPSYALKEKALVGSGKLNYRRYYKNSSLYVANYRIKGTSFHYAPKLRFYSFTPSVTLGFRPNDMRSNKKKVISLRYVNIFRDRVSSLEQDDTDPDYSVFNIRYRSSNNNALKHLSYFSDFQLASNFSKISFNLDYRKLFDNNRQLNVRLFLGKFLKNNTNTDFFSFALDRPTDYLFDYNYYGRSEDAGLFSQQLIIAEGGFKSKLENPYANDWMATTNVSFNVWKWIELYGDAGFIKNKGNSERFVYDSGIRLNLVSDYFELYFPIYSNKGWEVSQPQYDQKIRFIVTLSPKTLISLFTRRWY